MRNFKVALFASLTESVRFLVVVFIMTLAAGCGADPTQPQSESETLKCTSNADCGEGGVCIVDSGLCRGPQGVPGKEGVSCMVSETSTGASISCSDGTTATVKNGTDGKNGLDGLDGSSCSAFPNSDGTKIVKCTDGTSFTMKDGADGTTTIVIINNDDVDPIPVPECITNADCGAGSQWCENNNLYQTKASCVSGTCVPEDYFFKSCDYGCTDGTGCHSAPTPPCNVGASCDDGNINTTNDRLNASCVCVGTTTPSAQTCDDFNPCTQGTTFVNGLCAGGTINVGATCDDGDSATTGDQCGASGVCNGTPIVLPTVNCYTLRVKQGFQFFGLVSYADANNGWPVGEWQNLGREVTWCEGQVFGFNVVTNHEGEAQDWVGSGNVDGQGNLCSGAVPNITLIPQGINPKWTLNEVFDGSKPADLNGVYICSPGGWDDWLMPSPPAN